MSPRLKRLALDWKSYVALLAGASTALSAFTDLVEKLAKLLPAITELPVATKWVVAGAFLLISFLFLAAALSRRSVLLEPKRFLLSPDDPNHLVGREPEIDALARQCARHLMVFLVGDSGSGKSSLVRAGLAYHLRIGSDLVKSGSDLLPIVVDLSGLGWKRALRRALVRELNRLTADELRSLGLEKELTEKEVFARLKKRPTGTPRRLLVVLDQFDDYLSAHRERFYDGTTLRKPEAIKSTNADWRALSALLGIEALHVLVVVNSKAGASLKALCFVEEARIALEQLLSLNAKLVTPLFDRISEPDGERPVVSEPEFGWMQLRSRLLRHLQQSGEGAILPIRVAVVLNSLRLLPFLTVAEYEKAGGVRGLERLHIERHAGKAAQAAGVMPAAMLKALRTLVSADGVPVPRAEFAAILVEHSATSDGIAAAIKQLVDDKILRLVPGEGDSGEMLLLYHGYLARGIHEAYRQANRWTQLLHEKSHALSEAIGWRQQYRALLSPGEQLGVLWEASRGRVALGEWRGLVARSTLRWATLVAALALAAALTWGAIDYHQRQIAAEVMAMIGHTIPIQAAEAKQLRRLNAAGGGAVGHALHQALHDGETAGRALMRTEYLTSLFMRVDFDGNRADRFGRREFASAIQGGGLNEIRLAGNLCARFPLKPDTARACAEVVVGRMTTAQGNALRELGELLGKLSAKLNDPDRASLAQVLVGRIKTEQAAYALARLGQALNELNAKLEHPDLVPVAKAVLVRMKSLDHSFELANLGGARASPRPAVAQRLDRSYELANLGDVLGTLSAQLERSELASGAGALVAQMKIEENNEALARLGEALGELTEKLGRSDLAPLARELISRMKTEEDSTALETLGEALSKLSAKLEPADLDLAPLVLALADRIKTEQLGYYRLAHWGQELARLSVKLKQTDLQPGVQALADRMNTEKNGLELAGLGESLANLSTKLERSDIKRGVAALVGLMETDDGFSLEALGKALGKLSASLGRSDLVPFANTLVGRMENEQSDNSLAKLGESLGQLSAKLERADLARGAEALVRRMKTVQNSSVLASLGQALGKLSTRLERTDLAPGAEALVLQMKLPQNNFALPQLGEALGELSAKLERTDLAPGVEVLVGQMKTQGRYTQASLGKALAMMSAKLESGSIQAATEMLARSIANEWDSRILDELTFAFVKLETEIPKPLVFSPYRQPVRAEQLYADLLKNPCIVGKAQATLLKRLEGLTGQTFDGDAWKFAQWVTKTDAGRALKLDLKGASPWE